MSIKTTVFPGNANIVRWHLVLNGEPWNLVDQGITKVELKAGTQTVSSDSNPDIGWSDDLLWFRPGLLFPNLAAGSHGARLKVFTTLDPDGIVWDADIQFVVDC